MTTQTPQRLPRRRDTSSHKKREVTPARTNKNSLDERVQAALIRDVEDVESQDKNDFVFDYKPEYRKFGSRDAVRKRFYYYRDIKCDKPREVWIRSVKWAEKIPFIGEFVKQFVHVSRV